MRHSSHDSSLSNFLIGVVVGLLTGGVLSLMYSPNSGDENRRKAKEWADEKKQWAEEKKETLKEEIQNPYSKARQFIDEKRYTVEEQWKRWQNERQAVKASEAKDKEAEAYDSDVVDVDHTLASDEKTEHTV
jgi:gas vesicle protein